MACLVEGDHGGPAESPGEPKKSNRSQGWSHPVLVKARNSLPMSQDPEVGTHTELNVTAIDAATESGEG